MGINSGPPGGPFRELGNGVGPDEELIYCQDCKYLNAGISVYKCIAPQNLHPTWLCPAPRNAPQNINKDNNCPWFKSRQT